VSFPITALISLLAYFIIRLILSSTKQLFVALLIAFISILGLMITSTGFNALAIHMTITCFSIVILIVTFFETTLLERHITKIKKGEIGSNTKSVEREYSEIFNLVGLGLACLTLSLLSGLWIGEAFTLEIIFKIIFTLFAIILYLLTFLGIKYANLKVRYAVRGIMLSFMMILLAYFGNSIILNNYL
jgi:ABC-type uncharacterized transport system permease subunit